MELVINSDSWFIKYGNLCEIETSTIIDEIKKLIEDFLSNQKKPKSAAQILKIVLKKYFNVSKVSIYTQNNLYMQLVEFINMSDYQKKFALVCLDPESNSIVMKTKCYKFTKKEVTIENLKKQIQDYIRLNPKDIKVSNIIFNSLELLSGYKANRKVKKYYKKGIKDFCLENPIYTMLVKYVEFLPEYKENLAKIKKYSEIQRNTEKSARIIQKQKDFLDRKLEYIESYENKHLVYNTRNYRS